MRGDRSFALTMGVRNSMCTGTGPIQQAGLLFWADMTGISKKMKKATYGQMPPSVPLRNVHLIIVS